MTFQDRAIVLRPGEGKTVSVFGDRRTYKAVGKQTGEAFGLVEIAMPAPAAGRRRTSTATPMKPSTCSRGSSRC